MSVLALLVAASAITSAEPYVRTRVDSADLRSHCLYWEDPDVTFRQHPRGNADTPGENEFGAFKRAMETWSNAAAPCSSLVLRDGPRTNETHLAIGWVEDSDDNENLLIYRPRDCDDVVQRSDSCWKDFTCQNKHDCWDQSDKTIAVTTTTFHEVAGRIFDADIEGNEAHFLFTTVDAPECVAPAFDVSCVATDIQNTMTHELGHAIGLDHAPQSFSTMAATANPGETSKRQLDSATKEFICEAYPANAPSQDCVSVRAQSSLGQSASCAAAFGDPMTLLALLGALGIRRTRREVRS
jgi:hypothetical protein